MPNRKKFGAFAGVFTPSLLTILGVIMYMRLGWVVGNAGLMGAILVIIIAHIISITTGLSISSIATDKKIGAGGVYYVLSRSLGLPIGGSIGITLFVGTAMSIALYLIGFAESFNDYLGLDNSINGLRIGGSLALLSLMILALISTSFALKTQFFILAAIIISIISIVIGVSPQAPEYLSFFGEAGNASMETVFAIFFPAVTGFTAGIAMSGDLKDPKKSIPSGTLWAIGVGFIVYVGLAIFIFYSVDSELLKTDNNVLLKLARFAPAVVAGIWGATLSSALGGILGGPRILQAMSVDKITPKRFAKGIGKGNEPRNALILTILIAEAGILIGELDTIARICSMFYLAAYGFINLSFYLESWASSDFNPTFKVKKWVGLVGFIATFVVMFRLDMGAMVAAFLVIGGIYFWLAKKELALGSGDIWQSVWSSVVKTGLRRMDEKQDHMRNWKPNVLLFSGGTDQRPYLLEFSKELVGNRGIVTNFDLHENEDAAVLFPKHKQRVRDDILKKYGVFGRQVEVKNVFKGIESIAATFGFSGIEPNTILMGWAKNTKDPIWFAQMTQKLIDLDYNVLYLDYDERFGFRKYARIDLWWRGVGNNAELMLNISKFLHASDHWRNAQIRILLVENTNSNKKVIERKVNKLLEEFRVIASVKIIANAIEKRPIYELMKVYSSESDLVFVGIPNVQLDKAGRFVNQTNDLVGTIGTTLMVKASSHFVDIDFVSADRNKQSEILIKESASKTLPALTITNDSILDGEISKIDNGLHLSSTHFVNEAIGPIQEKYVGYYSLLLDGLELIEKSDPATRDIYQLFSKYLGLIQSNLEQLRTVDLPIITELFVEANNKFLEALDVFLKNIPKRIKTRNLQHSTSIKLRKIAQALKSQDLISPLRKIYIDFGAKCYENLFKTQNEIIGKIYSLFEIEGFYQNNQLFNEEIQSLSIELKELVVEQRSFFLNIREQLEVDILTVNRGYCNDLANVLNAPDIWQNVKDIKSRQSKRVRKNYYLDLVLFPTNWNKNQEIIHSSMETNFKLAVVNIANSKEVGAIAYRLEQEVNSRIESLFEEHATKLNTLHDEIDKELDLVVLNELSTDEISFPGIDFFVDSLKQHTNLVPDRIQGDVNLMSKPLMEDFEILQLEGVIPVSLELGKIIDFILESELNGPVQNLIDRYLNDVSSIYFNQISRINLLKYALSESGEEAKANQLLDKILIKFSEEKKSYENLKTRFNESLRAIGYDLQMELDSRYLVERADNWNRYISVSKRKKGLAKLNERLRAKLLEWYEQVSGVVSEKQYESTVSIFESKYRLKSNIEMGLDFVDKLYPRKKVLDELPFYYKQLFQGKHLPVQQDYIGRTRELEQIDVAIAQGRDRVFLVVGKSATGKTHFSEYIADTRFEGSVFRIDSFSVQGSTKELRRAFASATQINGEIETCLSEVPANSIFIINDIEAWWDRSKAKDTLMILLEMIERFSKKHRFILNVNLHALEAISNQRHLKNVITNTIVLAPIQKKVLRSVIVERHKVGGLDMIIHEEENRGEGKYFNRLINRLFLECDGNIGLGMQAWLRQVTSFADNKIYITEQPILGVLNVDDPLWKWLLYQFLINGNLTEAKLKSLFGDDLIEMKSCLQELLKTGLLNEVGRKTYSLNKIVKPNIENWLEKNSVLN